MKTMILRTVRTLCVTVLVSACAVSAYADGKMAAKEKTCSGTITAVDAKEKVIKVQRYLLNKTFVLGENCVLALSNKKEASLGDFRPGQKVNVNYIDASGVLVADRIAQEELRFSGQVRALDRNAHTLRIGHWGTGKTFTIAGDCNVLLNGDAKGGLDDVKVGNRVTVIYEVPANRLTARQIEQRSILFVGSLQAISLSDQTVCAGNGHRKDTVFHLADNCAIIKDGKPEGRLNDLRLGQKYELSYDSVDGVNVVNRIAPAGAPEKPAMSQHAAKTAEQAN